MEDLTDRSRRGRNPEIETATRQKHSCRRGATLIGSLMNAGLIDDVRVLINPLLLGGGKALFKDVKERKALKQVRTKTLRSGKVSLTYTV